MRGRSAYNPVSSTEEVEDLENQQTEVTSPDSPSSVDNAGTSSTANSGNSRPATTSNSRGANYSRLADVATKQEDGIVNDSTSLVDSVENDSVGTEGYSDSDVDSANAPGENSITVIVLDSVQKKFPIKVDPDWKVSKLKIVGAKIHKVTPPAQRLIFRGRMLEDGKTLKEMGIHQNDVFIHLFPKPRVIVGQSSSRSDSKCASTEGQEEQAEDSGAHVPQIYMDEEEQQRRGQILVLGSHEISEAQNNVRLLSLLLGTICVMRLLALLSIATGADEVPVYEDDLNPTPSGDGGNSTADDGSYSHVDYESRTWKNQDYFDLLVSTVGFFVARLGMKATQENTSRLATQYLMGTMIAGILWNIWNVLEFVLFVKEETAPKDDDDEAPLTNDDFRTIALFTVMLPLGVWFMCCARAWQFRHLIEEAEQEAADRIRSEVNSTENTQPSGGSGGEIAPELEDINERPEIV